MRTLLLALFLFALAVPVAAQDRDHFEEACTFGDLGACNVLGLMYETGAGVDQDLERAGETYGRACDAGEMSGCTSLGLLLAQGFGMPRDRPGAAELYRQACDAGDDFGCDLLAALEHEGPITEPQRFFKRGRVGDAESANMLAGALVEVPALGVRSLTDAQGRISLGRVEEGHYDLRAEALGYEPIYGTVIVPGYSEFVVLLNEMRWESPNAPGRVQGRVTDETGAGIANVEVAVMGQQRSRSLTNAEGRFIVEGVSMGLVTIQFSRLGYADRETMLIVQPGATAQVDATMTTDAIALAPIDVTVEDRSAYLQRNGYYRRARGGFGQHLVRADFHGEYFLVGDMLREARGIRVSPPDPQGRQFVRGARASNTCQFSVYYDGAMTRDGNLNNARPDQIEAVEVYQGLEVPPEYSRLGNCGVVLIWTIRP